MYKVEDNLQTTNDSLTLSCCVYRIHMVKSKALYSFPVNFISNVNSIDIYLFIRIGGGYRLNGRNVTQSICFFRMVPPLDRAIVLMYARGGSQSQSIFAHYL
jgi:hypothetical protein